MRVATPRKPLDRLCENEFIILLVTMSDVESSFPVSASSPAGIEPALVARNDAAIKGELSGKNICNLLPRMNFLAG